MNLRDLKPAQDFARRMGVSGIYCILNIANNKLYIGSAICIKQRLKNHKKYLTANKHPNKHLQSAWNNCAIDFSFYIIELVDDKNKLLEREQYWIDFYNSNNNNHGYNKRAKVNSNLGLKASAETKAKMSIASKGHKRNNGRKLSQDHKNKLSAALKGRKHSKEHIEKRIAYKRGKPISQEQKFKISDTLRKNSFIPITEPQVLS